MTSRLRSVLMLSSYREAVDWVRQDKGTSASMKSGKWRWPKGRRGAAPAADMAGLSLRLGRVTAGDQLRQRIVYREAPDEIAYYEDRRWAETPEAYARAALSRVLFEERGLGRVLSGAAPMLEVELLAFEEIRGQGPLARVAMTAVLHDQKRVVLQRTFVIDRPFDANDDGALARAMAEALRAVVEQVADESTARLRGMRDATELPPCRDVTEEVSC